MITIHALPKLFFLGDEATAWSPSEITFHGHLHVEMPAAYSRFPSSSFSFLLRLLPLDFSRQTVICHTSATT